MYLVGEALVGDGPEVAHVDVLVGDKEGYVGQAFANSFSQLSVGHTPLLAVIRPNLIAKPATLLVPKVTVKGLEDAGRVFGPAQAAIGKAVVDSVEDGIIPKDELENWVIICGVFVHPDAKDYRKIYHYNYGATKLALKRALTGYPNIDKVLYEKDRATHPIMGFKVPRLWRPPYLQVVLDVPDIDRSKMVVSQIPRSDRIILEIGSPLIKKYGAKAINEIRAQARDVFIIADFKTLDIGKVEVDIAFEETADGVTVSGLAPAATIWNIWQTL
jgi:bifunctional enzyme Fae/Hps